MLSISNQNKCEALGKLAMMKLTLSRGARSQGLTEVRAARVVGPANDGIQKKPSVRRPLSATFERALQQTTGHISKQPS